MEAAYARSLKQNTRNFIDWQRFLAAGRISPSRKSSSSGTLTASLACPMHNDFA
jgi:hypothetical protein